MRFMLLLLVVVAVFQSTNSLELDTNEQKTTELVESLISRILLQCYIIQIRNHRINSHPSFLTRHQTPLININLDRIRFIEFNDLFQALGIKQIIRHQLQCVTFYIRLEETTTKQELGRISKIFSRSSLQPQAHTSYIIMHQAGNSELQQNLLLSSELKNFPNRVWVHLNEEDQETLQIHHFCYYCSNGNPGLRLMNSPPGPRSREQIFSDATRNLDGHTLRCTAPPAPPLVAILPSKADPKELTIVGMQAVLLTSMANTLNFTYSLKKATGGLTGAKLDNGTWTGIMGEILRDEADIGLSVATSYDRNKLLDFTVPVFNAFLVMVSTKPRPFFDWEAIFHPFIISAWLTIFVCTILSIVTYRLLHNYSLKFERPNANRGKVSMFKATYLMVGALLEQGVPQISTMIPSRFYVGIWFFFSIVITCAYKSKLYLFLTFPIIERPPSSFYELSESDYKWGLKSLGGVGLLFITQSPVAYVRYIGEHLQISTDKYSCLDRTVTEKFVCIIYRAYIDYMSELRYWKIKHKFFISDYLTFPVGSSWALRKYSPLLSIFDKFQISQFEMGLANKYVDHYMQEVAKQFRISVQKSNSTEDTFDLNTNYVPEAGGVKPLQIENLYGAFFILFLGLSLCLICFVVEIIKNRSALSASPKLGKPIVERLERRAERTRLGVAFGLMPRKRTTILSRSD